MAERRIIWMPFVTTSEMYSNGEKKARMRTVVHISFNGRLIPGGPTAVLEQARLLPNEATINDMDFLNQTFVSVTLDETDPRMGELLRLVEPYQHKALSGRHDLYTEEELQAAPLLYMWMTIEHDVLGGQVFGETTYDLSNACSNCGTGARQTSPLYIDAKDIKKIKGRAVAATTYQDLFVKEKMIVRLHDAGITDFATQDVYSRRKDGGTTKLPRTQIIPNHTMPPMHPLTNLDPQYVCKVCQRGGFFSMSREPFRIYYRRQDLANIADFNRTWEWFGSAHFNWPMSQLRFAHPYALVTPKVMNILRESVADDAFHWAPIWVVEE